MAGLVVCDFCEEGSFVPAVVHAYASKIERSTVSPIYSKDACLEHLKTATLECWNVGFVTPDFYEIRIVPV